MVESIKKTPTKTNPRKSVSHEKNKVSPRTQKQTRHTQADIQNAQVSFTDPLPPLKFRAVVLLFLSPKRRNIWYGSSHQLGFSPRDTRIKKEMVQLSAPVKLGCGNRRVSCRHLSPGWKFTFQWFTSSWPLYSKTPATTSHSHSQKTSKVESLFFSEKLATLLFSGLPLLDPSTAKLRPLHPIPTAWTPQK